MYTRFLQRFRGQSALVDDDGVGPLIGLAAVTDLLLSWARRPGVDHLADDRLLADLRAFRLRVEHELSSRAARSNS
jgi:hypothetical protein